MAKATNFSFNKLSAPMQPTIIMDTYTKTLNIQATLKVVEIEEAPDLNYQQLHKL